MENLIKELEIKIDNFQRLIDNFPSNRREEILFDKWSLKDVLAHFSGWNHLTVKELAMLQKGKKVEQWTGGGYTDEFNEIETLKRKSLSWDEVYIEFKESFKDLMAKYQELTPDLWSSRFGPEETDTPVRSLKLDIEHIDEHSQDLKIFTL